MTEVPMWVECSGDLDFPRDAVHTCHVREVDTGAG